MKKLLSIPSLLLAIFCVASVPASAQTISKAGNISKTATITAINHSTRVVTLKDAQGNIDDVRCGPEIARFNELKVGDMVTFSYHAAVVVELAKPGDKPAAGAAVTRGQGVRPSGAVTQQKKATVTIDAIDQATPSVTVKTADGRRMTALVEDKKNLEGLKAGDKVDITFTEALMVTVESAKK